MNSEKDLPLSAISFRSAAEKDFDSVYELYMDERSNAYLTYDLMDKQSFEVIFAELLPTNTLYVAESENEIIATYRLIRKTHRQACTLYLGGFVVKNLYKGKGIGTKVLENIKVTALRKGIKRIELTVSLDNKPAIELYKKTGFEIEGLIRMSYRLSNNEYYDEYLMSVIL